MLRETTRARISPRFLLLLLTVLGIFSGLLADASPAAAPLNARTKSQIVKTLAREVAGQHAVPDTGTRTAKFLLMRLLSGAYEEIADGSAFASQLGQDMRSASSDKHLQVFYSPTPQQWIPTPPSTPEEQKERREKERQSGSADNFGFKRAELLPANVGYLELTRLASPEFGGEAAQAAMAFLQNADGLILDLRGAGGGDQAMAALLLGYVMGPEPVQMSTSQFRNGRVEQYWSNRSRARSFHPLQTKPIYLLTSESTFSAGEYLPFVLKSWGRATVVGERTGGGAYGGHTVALSPHFAAWISISRPVVPRVKGDWEARGITPHIAVPAAQALLAAQADILTRRATSMGAGADRTELEWIAERLLAQAKPVRPGNDLLSYAGVYGERVVTVQGEQLRHRRGDGLERRLIPLGSDRFALDGYEAFRLRFVRDGSGRVIALETRGPDGPPAQQSKQ